MTSTSTHSRLSHSLAWRALWVVLLAGHVKATISAVSATDLLGTLILLFSQSFFVLKLLDVPWLRVKLNARSALAITAGVVLLHARVLDSTQPHTPDSLTTGQAIVLASGASLLAGTLLLRRYAPARRTATARRGAGSGLRLFVAAICRDLLPPRDPRWLSHGSVNRAPPCAA